MNKEVGVSPTQMEFIDSPDEYTLYCGGLGSGKTHAGALWAAMMICKYPGVTGLITANSYSQLKKATLAKLFEILEDLGLEYVYKSQDGILLVGETVIYCMSMEKYDLFRGIEVGWAWSDEIAFSREIAFNVMVGRIRDNSGPCQWKGTTTPNGYNWLYKKFVSSPLSSSKVVYSKTAQNLANLKQSYVTDLREQYDTKLAQQELDGQFVNLTSGKVYYNFDRKRHVQNVSDNNHIMFVGLDFNVNPLCGVFCYFEGEKIYVSGELYLTNSNTFAAAKEILARYPQRQMNIIPDETGNRRRSSSNATDHEILRRANLHVMKFKNPSVKDRYNNLNRLFEQGRIIIDPSCKYLIEDLEQLVYDNKDEMLSHSSDAFGYAAWHLFPLKKPRRPVTVTYR